MQMKFCPNCGKQTDDIHPFCSGCGYKFPAAAPSNNAYAYQTPPTQPPVKTKKSKTPLVIIIAVIAVLAIAAAAHVGVRTGRKNLGRVLACAGGLTIAAFAAFGAAALIDFDAFFSLVHGLFFAQGTWTFWYRSLLICSLPEGFWMGMGILWFATSLLLSILSCCVGAHLTKKRSARTQTTDIQSTRFNR